MSTLDVEIGLAAKRCCLAYAEYVEKEQQTKRAIEHTPLPCFEEPMDTNSCDKLEQVGFRLTASEAVNSGLIPSRVKSKTLKLVFTASLLDVQDSKGTVWRTNRQV